MPILLSEITAVDKANALFNNRRPAEAETNRKFYDGDHYQDSLGYMGQLPPAGVAYRTQTLMEIEEGFVSENVIKEAVDRHVAGPLGRECLWGFIPADMPSPGASVRRKLFSKLFKLAASVTESTSPATDKSAQEADEACTVWWDNRRPRNTLKEALTTSLLEDRALIRIFFPPGLRDEQGKIQTRKDLASALTVPRLNIVTADKGGVFTDEDTEEEFGVYIYQNGDKKNVAELTYVNSGGMTVLRVLVERETPQEFFFDLGGRLLMYELRREALISEQVRSEQRALNLSLTSMMRNVNLAGNLERTVMNAERPKKVIRVTDDSALGYHEETRDADYEVGPGASMFLSGLLIRNDAGEVIGRANPNISFRQPVDVKNFTETRDQYYAAILGQCQQRHVLISGDATASGRSREQARAEFHGSIMLSKEVIDDAGRWLMETQLRLGAQLCGRSREFLELRCEFNSIIEDGPTDASDRQENRADVQAGLMSKETAMSRNGVEDTDAEVERIEEDKANAPAPIDLNQDPAGNQLPVN